MSSAGLSEDEAKDTCVFGRYTKDVLMCVERGTVLSAVFLYTSLARDLRSISMRYSRISAMVVSTKLCLLRKPSK